MQAAEAAQTLVQRLLAFARRQPLQPTAVDLHALLTGMESLLANTLGQPIDLAIEVPADLPPVRADAHQLELAILNLAVNSRDAMPDGGRLTIAAAVRASNLPSGLARRRYVRLTVSDTGTGMSEKVRAAAMEPFFTTKPSGQGTGLGLSMAHGLVGQLGGALEIESEIGLGTQVQMWLPVEQRKAHATDEGSPPDAERGAQGKVLLVDDNALVRHATREMLADIGYDVVDVDHAELALSMMEEGLQPDILVTDHVMPGMSGVELALRVRVDHPNVALLIISGYQGIDLVAPDIVRLSKPFRCGHLQASIAAARAQVH